MKRWMLLVALLLFWVMAMFVLPGEAQTQAGPTTDTQAAPASPALPNAETASKNDTGDIAWMLIATALVMLMTPGLAFFYGGMVGRKNVLGILMQHRRQCVRESFVLFCCGHCAAPPVFS